MVPRKESKFKEVPYQKLGRFIAGIGKLIKILDFVFKITLNKPQYDWFPVKSQNSKKLKRTRFATIFGR